MVLLDPRLRKRLDEKLAKLNALRPLDPAQIEKLREQLEVEMTYNSNAIEGNSLTLRETWLVLQEGMTIKGKPLKDHLEAKDHKEALDFLYDLVSQDAYTISGHRICRTVPHRLRDHRRSRSYASRRCRCATPDGRAHALAQEEPESAASSRTRGAPSSQTRLRSPVLRWERTDGASCDERPSHAQRLPARDHSQERP